MLKSTTICCPKCGNPMKLNTDMILASLPPQYQYECDNCGYICYSGSMSTNIDTYTPPQYFANREGWICPICGTPISPYIDYCPVCTKKQSTTFDCSGTGQPINKKLLNTAISSTGTSMKQKEKEQQQNKGGNKIWNNIKHRG